MTANTLKISMSFRQSEGTSDEKSNKFESANKEIPQSLKKAHFGMTG